MSVHLLVGLISLCAVPQDAGIGRAEIERQVTVFLESSGRRRIAAVQLLARKPRVTRDVIDARLEKEEDPAAKEKLTSLRGRVLELGLIQIINERTASSLTYSGQWADLSQYDPKIGALLLGLVLEEAVPAFLREAALNAIADLKQTELVPELTTIAADILNPDWLVEAAGLGLAELGERSWVDRRIAAFKDDLAAAPADVPRRYAAYKQLARFHYRLGEYRQAIEDYQGALSILEGRLTTIEERNARYLRRTLWLTYYNTACSASKAGDVDAAFGYLERAMGAEPDAEAAVELEGNIQQDGDLREVRADPRYGDLLKKLRARSRTGPLKT